MPTINRVDQNTRSPSVVTSTIDWMTETATFAAEFFRHPKTLGTPFICSSYAAAELLKYVKSEGPAKNYLEVGAGTGAITRHFVKFLRPEDRLDIVEIDPTLSGVLSKSYGHLANVFIHNSPVQEWNAGNRKFDAIVSTVPLNSLPSAKVLDDIFRAYIKLLKPTGTISSLEYVGTSTLSKTFYVGETRKTFDGIYAVKNGFFKKYSFERPIVFANFPPARISHCRISANQTPV